MSHSDDGRIERTKKKMKEILWSPNFVLLWKKSLHALAMLSTMVDRIKLHAQLLQRRTSWKNYPPRFENRGTRLGTNWQVRNSGSHPHPNISIQHSYRFLNCFLFYLFFILSFISILFLHVCHTSCVLFSMFSSRRHEPVSQRDETYGYRTKKRPHQSQTRYLYFFFLICTPFALAWWVLCIVCPPVPEMCIL